MLVFELDAYKESEKKLLLNREFRDFGVSSRI